MLNGMWLRKCKKIDKNLMSSSVFETVLS